MDDTGMRERFGRVLDQKYPHFDAAKRERWLDSLCARTREELDQGVPEAKALQQQGFTDEEVMRLIWQRIEHSGRRLKP